MSMSGAPSSRVDRTLRYTGGTQPTVPAGVASGPRTASSAVGQAAILSAVNMLARVHPGVILAFPDASLIVPSPLGGSTLLDACARLAGAASPDIEVTVARDVPLDVPGLGIGGDAGRASIYAGGARWTARTGGAPLEITAEPSSLLGVGLAVTLAAGFVFRAALGLPTRTDRAVSLWSLAGCEEPDGPGDLGPLDVGSVWLVGAGAVGSSLAWWLPFVRVEGAWTIIDGDVADETNLNRSLGLFAGDTGLLGGPPRAKSDAVVAWVPGALSQPHWWNQWCATDPPSPDVLIPVANEHGVRAAVAAYGHPAAIHATTSRNWTAELHRQLPDRDGCIACRLPEAAPSFTCASAPCSVDEHDPGRDASLPFLSGAAGLALLAGLLQLQSGQWVSHERNHWRLWYDDSASDLTAAQWSCNSGCTATPPAAVRRAIHGQTRWQHLDCR